MSKKLLVFLFVVLIGFVFIGCAKVNDTATTKSSLPTGVSPGSPIPSPEANLTGAVSILSGGVTTLNLGGIIPTGSSESVPVDISHLTCYVSKGIHTSGLSAMSTTEWSLVSTGFYEVSATPIDIVFILDNTGSMGGTIDGVKDSIDNFAQTLEANSVDAKFGLVTYGDSALHPTPAGSITSEGFYDASYPRPILNFSSAEALSNILSTEVFADGGGDGPENPLDAVKWALTVNATTGAFTNLTWRPGAQKIFIILTDINGHQTSEATFINPYGSPVTDEASNNKCTTTILTELARIKNFNAKVYAVSPDYTVSQLPYADVRLLADGFGEGRTTAEAITFTSGGQWIELPSGGSVDLSELGISSTLISGRTIRLEGYTFENGEAYTLIVYYDVDGDGIMDSYAYFVFTYSTSGSSSIKLAKKGKIIPAPLGLNN